MSIGSPIIHPHTHSHIDLKVNIITHINLIGPPISPDSKDIAVPLATVILDLTPKWTLLANLILPISCSGW